MSSNDIDGTSKQILELLISLLDILKKTGDSEVVFATREIEYAIEILSQSLCHQSDAGEVLNEVKVIYKRIHPSRGGFTDFFIWRDDFTERLQTNEQLIEIRDNLNSLLC